VGEHARDEVARRAGVEPEYVDRLVELGILKPDPGDRFTTGDVRRARWVRGFEEAGVPLEGIAAVERNGTLSFSYLDASAFDRFAGLSGTTFRKLSEDTGIPLDVLGNAREALGFARPGPDDFVREDELPIYRAVALQRSVGLRPEVIEAWLRVCADALRRIAETETDWWKTDVEVPLLEGGMTQVEMLEAQAEIGSRMTPMLEDVVVGIYRMQQEHAWTKGAVGDIEEALEKAGLHSRLRRPPAMAFLDISGYTRLTEERGDEAAADLAGAVSGLVRRASQEHGGQPVKWLGDGVMLYFPNPGQAVLAALEMIDGVEGQDLPPARVGIEAGPVVFQEGDYFGRTVNVAARIGEYARPGEVLVTADVVEASDGLPVTFTDVGQVELKGVSAATRLFAAGRAA
jgi:class 3 adenylate cyclase